MMTRMRQMTKVLFIFIALAFVAMIVFQWGADVNRGRSKTTVGEVNGKKLSITKYNEMYNQLYENERQRLNGEPDDATVERLRNQVWEQFIQSTLFKEEMDKMNIAVTDSEIVYQIMNNPLPQFRQDPNLQTNGVFDMNKYRAAMQNPNIPWGQIENYYRQNIPFEKLRSLITSSVRVSPSEIRDAFIRQNVKAKVEYISVLGTRFQKQVNATPEEMQSYYDAHQDEYHRNEMRNMAFVLFSLVPTKQDTERVYRDIDEIKSRLANGEDFNTLALEYSEDPSVKTNKGELGYFDRKAMAKPFSDAAFSAKPGDIVGPVKSKFGFHIIKIEDRKKEKGVIKVKASHILLKVVIGPTTMGAQEDRARLFAEDAKDKGWDKTAKANHYKVHTTGFFENRGGMVPSIGKNAAISNFAFMNEKGTISRVFTLDASYAVFKIIDIKEAGNKPLKEVEGLVRNQVKFSKAMDKARALAKSFAPAIKAGKSLKRIAESDTSKIAHYDISNLFSLDENVSNVGRYPEFNATAFTLNVGETSGLIKTKYAYFYQKLLEKTKFDSAAFNAQKTSIATRLLSQKQAQVFSNWYNSLKEKADIVDDRKIFNLF